ncbi:HTH-type transcriptional regulator LrpB [Flavobacteriaceae bacterium UJ101]|nr:HTH-type transcriptional regulator LrpB [Flavobacteriaceae bacterium UJ101]
MKLDSINWAILEIIQENARLSYAEIGRKVGLTAPAVSDRIQKMEDAEIITGYRTIVNYKEVGFYLEAIITLKTFRGKLNGFLEKVKTIEEVKSCKRITGYENVVMKVIFKDHQHMEEIIDVFNNYGEVKTYIVLSDTIVDRSVKKIF